MSDLMSSIKLSLRIKECQDSAKKLYGDEYPEKIKEYKQNINKLREVAQCGIIQAMTEIISLPSIMENGMATMLFIAAAADIIEEEKHTYIKNNMETTEETPSREMPKYQSHKNVWALKIKSIHFEKGGEDGFNAESAIITPEEDGYAPFRVDADYMKKHTPMAGGYFVRYANGYTSYSPAKEFEEGYFLIK